jgi:hypothetical protein
MVAVQRIAQSVLEGAEPQLVVSPLVKTFAENWLADLL